MAEATEARSTPRSVSLDVERVELTAQGSLVIEGRWYGVRGRRFVRPALMLSTGGQRRRLLADVEHKPWSAEEGELWLAAFPWGFDQTTEMTELELTVAPDIVVAVVPSVLGAVSRRPDGSRPRRSTAAVLRGQLDRARKELAAERERVDRLHAELARTQAAQAQESAVEKIDELASALDAALAERQAAIDQRGSAVRERETALAERQAAIGARDQAVTERNQAAEAARQRTAERDMAISERRTAIAARDQAITERDQARHAAHRLTIELHELRRMTIARDPPPAPYPLAEQPSAPTPAPPRSALTSTRPRTSGRPPSARLAQRPSWLARIVAVALLIVVLLVLAIIVGLLRP